MSIFRPEQAIPNSSGSTLFGLGIRSVDDGRQMVIVQNGNSNGTPNGTPHGAIDVQQLDMRTGAMSAPQIVTPRGSSTAYSYALWGDAHGGLGAYVAAWQDWNGNLAVGAQDACAVRHYSPRTKRWENIAIGPRLLMTGGLVEQKPVHVLRLTSGRFLVVYNAWEPTAGVAQIRGRIFDPLTLTLSADTVLYQGVAGVDDYTNHPMYACARMGGSRDEAHLLLYNDPLNASLDTMVHLQITELVTTLSGKSVGGACAGQIVTVGGRLFCVSAEVLQTESPNIFREPLGIGIRDDGSLLVFYWQKYTVDPAKYDRLYYMYYLTGMSGWSGNHLFRDWQDLYGADGPPTVPGILNCSGVDIAGSGLAWHFVWDEQRNGTPGDGNSDVFYGKITIPITAPFPSGPFAITITTEIQRLNTDHGSPYSDVQPKIAISPYTGELVPVWACNIYETGGRGPVSAKWSPCTACVGTTDPGSPLPSASEDCVTVLCGGVGTVDASVALPTQAEALIEGLGVRSTGWAVP
jgi:hypothetical protein